MIQAWQKTYKKAGAGIKGPHRMFVSPDGLRWTWSAVCFRGLRAADTSKRAWPLAHPIVKRDEVWIYYYGTNQSHGDVRGQLRLDGFVSADFDAVAGGTLTTSLFRFQGSALESRPFAAG